jgi:predicted GH43/DUF377 family glycosyl hydrolase
MSTKSYKRDVIHRWEGNPIITVRSLPFKCSDILNAGVVKYKGQYLLLMSIQRLNGCFAIYPAYSSNGYHFEIGDTPLIEPSKDEKYAVYEEIGVLDPRITQMGDEYFISYIAQGHHGYCLGLAKTKDFEHVEKIGLLTEVDTKAGCLFPEKINGKYAMLERPSVGNSIWISYSDDLVFWGWQEVVMTPRSGFWDTSRIGVASPPIEIEEGWLITYYGVKDTSAGPLYRIGAAILAKDNPAQVMGRTNIPILSPRQEYERIGDINNMVFSCGALIENNEDLRFYYGAANSCLCAGQAKVKDIVSLCLEEDKEY